MFGLLLHHSDTNLICLRLLLSFRSLVLDILLVCLLRTIVSSWNINYLALKLGHSIMLRIIAVSLFVFTFGVAAVAAPAISPDASLEKNVGNGKHIQPITGRCVSNADCASSCCAILGQIGICSGIPAQYQGGKTGCGFVGPPPIRTTTSARPVSTTPPPNGIGIKPDPTLEKNVGNADHRQPTSGRCIGNADCISACCATLGNIGICSSIAAQFQAGKMGCGFRAAGGV